MQNDAVLPYLHRCQNLSEGTEKTHEILVNYTYYSTTGHRELKSILTNPCDVKWANKVVARNNPRPTGV